MIDQKLSLQQKPHTSTYFFNFYHIDNFLNVKTLIYIYEIRIFFDIKAINEYSTNFFVDW